jgi:hypothetical protein
MSLLSATLFLATLNAATMSPAISPSQEFERGRTAFLRGEYERAVTIIYPLVYPDLRLESEVEVLQAHRMLGVSYLFENKQTEARDEFRKLLELSPDIRFDPLLDPPKVVEFFNGIVREQQAQLGDIEIRLKKREEELNRHVGQVLERRIERRSYIVNYVPFGAGQFQNQQRGKGWAFFGAEAGLASISMAAFVTNFAIYGARPTRGCIGGVPDPSQISTAPGVCPTSLIDHSAENRSRKIQDVQIMSGVAFFAVAIWGVIDALHNFQAEVPLGDRYVPAQTTGAWRLVPTVDSTSGGAALALTF